MKDKSYEVWSYPSDKFEYKYGFGHEALRPYFNSTQHDTTAIWVVILEIYNREET